VVAAAAATGILVLVLSLVFSWDDGIVAAAVMLFIAYIASLLFGGRPLDSSAPAVAAGLLLLVELASWSLELADGPEERAVAHLRQIALLAATAAAASSFVIVVGRARAGSSVIFLLLGAAAAVCLIALIAAPLRGRGKTERT
jgi:hypothetical protein